MTTTRDPVKIRPALDDDAEILADYNAALALETEGKRLDRETLRRGVAAAVADPERLRYWIAERDGRVVGQAAATREWSDWRNGWIWWLQSVYVPPEERGRGVFRALFQAIRAEAQADPGVVGLRLYVENENHAAQKTYQALGLKAGGYHVLEELWIEHHSAAVPSDAADGG
jgi:ribosomal protein S18 acetylase RimI-like enzyme